MPKQQPNKNQYGVYVHIDGVELARIQFDNFEKNEESVIQLHTHPGKNVEMSQLDREWEVINFPGALSIIVPNYGTSGMATFEGVNVYEKGEDDWHLLPHTEVLERLTIV